MELRVLDIIRRVKLSEDQDVAFGGIHLSHSRATIELGHNFMVTCRDEAGRPVSWSGPKGTLGTKTHPGVEVSSYGTSLAFMPVTKDDSGTYSCRVGHDVSQFHLSVEANNNKVTGIYDSGSNITLRNSKIIEDVKDKMWKNEQTFKTISGVQSAIIK
ncbi:hypothetical protein FQA39_LY17863 [Lamprigera yunnana]|nr:hypothetical protein FQA39_LY17863 [Lamprigera yunnana]